MLFNGVIFGAVMLAASYFTAPDLPVGIRVGLAALSAALFGIPMGWFAARQAAELRHAPDGTSPEEERLAMRAVMRGPVPTDPVVRQAASEVLQSQLRQARQWHRPGLALWLAFTALGVYLATTGSPVGWTTVVFLGFFVGQIWHVRHLAARSALFEAAS